MVCVSQNQIIRNWRKEMKLNMTTFAVAITAVILLATAFPANADNGSAPAGGCQPGADNQIIEGWQLLSLEGFAELLVEGGTLDDESALERATAIYAFCDHNGDDYTCVMEQNLPNDANGSSHWFLIEDNHPYGGY
jgi:hypothetical protein